ncbi:HAD-like domain-containing protein [Chiua virens]|nr:HAD-like domain-containing protein [Chiua virens]
MFLLGATAIEDKLQEAVPDTTHTLQMAGIKIWVLTGDRQETAINVGMNCRLIGESTSLMIVNEETAHVTTEFVSKWLSALKNQRSSGEQEDLALIIDGKSLTFALEKGVPQVVSELALLCKTDIRCRVSPLQKPLVVKLVEKNQNSILLAIGDGASDVSMIQASRVSKRRVQPTLPSRNSDISNGCSCICPSSLYFSMILLGPIVLLFNNVSGQIGCKPWTISFYNVIFTFLPPLVIVIFDQLVSARILDRYPQLYSLGQRNMFFTKTAFWLGNASYQSVILFWGDLNQAMRLDSGHWIWGTALYLTVLSTVLGEAAFMSAFISRGMPLSDDITSLWTKYTVAAIPGSFVFTMLFLPLYARIARCFDRVLWT